MSTGFLTTHVLDTAKGIPASGLQITLSNITQQNSHIIRQMTTNTDGRTDTPILPESEFKIGTFELIFHVENYLHFHFPELAMPHFLDNIPIRFTINDAESHYHVPLLLSPYGYSTYRGS